MCLGHEDVSPELTQARKALKDNCSQDIRDYLIDLEIAVENNVRRKLRKEPLPGHELYKSDAPTFRRAQLFDEAVRYGRFISSVDCGFALDITRQVREDEFNKAIDAYRVAVEEFTELRLSVKA